jgi:signal transduction histidine kinase/PAS domain-containing protein
MNSQFRPAGIEGLGDISWGTHFCIFYETKEDLLDIFIPFLKAGLEHQQFCLCVVSEPLTLEEVERAMRQALPDFERCLAEGQIEITPHTDWYLKDGRFEEQRVLQGWLDKLDQALAKRFSGVRFAVNLLLEKKDWMSFSRYEGKLEETLRDVQIEGLCAYNLNRQSAANLLDIMHHHQFTLARRDGNWEYLEGAQLRRLRDEVLKLNNELEQRVAERTFELEATNAQLRKEITDRKRAEKAIRKSEQILREAETLGHTGSWEQNLITGEIFQTEENRRLFFGNDRSKGANFEDYAQVVHPDDREYVLRRRAELLEEEGPSDIEYRVIWPDGNIHVIFGRATVVRNELGQAIRVYGTNVDITERKKAEEEVRRYATRMEALAEISRTFAEAGLDYQSVLNAVARRTAELIGDSCVITLFSGDAQRSFPVAFHHPNPKALSLMQEALLHTWQGGTDTQRYQTLLAGNNIYVPSVNPEEFQASLEPEFWTYFEAVGISSVLIVPLKTHSRVIGTLGITRDRQGNPYTHDDLTLLQNIADRAAMSIQNAQLFRQVQDAREQLEALSRQLLEVQEAERRVITTELHDRVGQNLTGLSINLQNMKALLPDETAQRLAKKFDDAQGLVEDTTRQIRDIMAELHLPELEDYGLAVALETYAERAASRGNLKLVMNLPDLAAPPLPSDVRIALFRSAQEAISNVMKHADATQLKVSLEEPNGRIRLRVEDNGRGFDPNLSSHTEAQTWGLKIMRERIELIGGNIQIKSEPGKGTQVTFEVERPS